MRALILIICVLLAVMLVLYPFAASGGAGNYTWFLLILPVFLFVGRVLADPADRPLRRRLPRRTALPGPRPPDTPFDNAEGDGLCQGVWSGSVRLFSSDPAQPMCIYPLRLRLATAPPAAHLVRIPPPGTDGIVGVDILAADSPWEELDLRLNLRVNGVITRHTAAIALSDGRWISADDSDPVVIDLSPLRSSRAIASA